MVKEEATKSDYRNLTIGKIVARDYRKAVVFKSFGLDFCCGGAIKVETAAEENNLDIAEIISALEEIDERFEPTENYNEWPLSALIDHIVSKHHNYVRTTIEQLTPMLTKVEMVHGTWRPELSEVKSSFLTLADELLQHMQKEEMILFPAIKKLALGSNDSSASPFGSVSNPINMMEHEHDIAGDLMKKINSLTDNYTIPKGACATFTVVYKTLKEFEDDLFTHIHLENNILFPKAIELEA
jgi:regulator of cell morphogenesis and NO signaling